MFKTYFRENDGPHPLVVTCSRRIRLEEVDALGIVWHGRYASFLEDGREELGRRYALGYRDFLDAGVVLPIRSLSIDYLAPLEYQQEIVIETSLQWHEAARLNISYRILRDDGEVSTLAATVQMMVDINGRLILESPDFYQDFQDRWRAGKFNSCE